MFADNFAQNFADEVAQNVTSSGPQPSRLSCRENSGVASGT